MPQHNAATEALLQAQRGQGATAAEAAAALAADPRFSRVVTKDLLRDLFARTALAYKLERARDNELLPDELRAGCARILMIAAWENGIADLTNAQYAAEFTAGVLALQQVGVLTDPEAEAVLALGGGYLVERLDADAVTAAWEGQDQRQQAATSLASIRTTIGFRTAALAQQLALAEALAAEVTAGLEGGALADLLLLESEL